MMFGTLYSLNELRFKISKVSSCSKYIISLYFVFVPGNCLESWSELLPALSQLNSLTFLNLARNRLMRDKVNTEACNVAI